MGITGSPWEGCKDRKGSPPLRQPSRHTPLYTFSQEEQSLVLTWGNLTASFTIPNLPMVVGGHLHGLYSQGERKTLTCLEQEVVLQIEARYPWGQAPTLPRELETEALSPWMYAFQKGGFQVPKETSLSGETCKKRYVTFDIHLRRTGRATLEKGEEGEGEVSSIIFNRGN